MRYVCLPRWIVLACVALPISGCAPKFNFTPSALSLGSSGPSGGTGGVVQIFRSVGPGNTAILACGTTGGGCTGQGNLTISGTTATFTSNVANNIGVGDAVVYDCNGDGSLGAGDCIAFISGRTSSTVYSVQSASGGVPASYGAASVWRIYRAYTSLANAVDATAGGTENSAISAIDPTLGNFDTWTGGTQLVAANDQWNVAVYADGVDSSSVDIEGNWQTSGSNFLRIYAPYSSSEVGVSQRSSGAWSSSGYQLAVNASGALNQAIVIGRDVTLDGLQVESTEDRPGGGGISILDSGFAGSGEIVISNCIINGVFSGSTYHDAIGFGSGAGGSYTETLKLYNNIIYSSGPSESGWGIGMAVTGGTTYAYNNTVVTISGSMGGFKIYLGIGALKNNIVQMVGGTGYYEGAGSWAVTSDYNLSNDSTSTGGSHDLINIPVSFNDPEDSDYRLSSSDNVARGGGDDLSSDPDLAFNTDVQGQARGTTWDIGASRATGTYRVFRSVGPGNTSILACGTTGGGCTGLGNLTISAGVVSFAAALPNTIGVGDAIVYDCNNNGSLGAGDCVAFISGRSSSTLYIASNPAGAAPTSYGPAAVWQIYRAYTSLHNALIGSGNENSAITAIDATLGNFDTWSSGKNIASASQQWNIACYADATDTTQALAQAAWVTSSSDFLRIFTPYLSTEVGTSQRHGGNLSSGGYEIVQGSSWFGSVDIETQFARVDGLIAENTEGSATGGAALGVNADDAYVGFTGSGAVYFTNNIAYETRTSGSASNPMGVISVGDNNHDALMNYYLYDNIIINGGSADDGIVVWDSPSFVYNNTVYNGYDCFQNYSGKAMLAKNNIAQSCLNASYQLSGTGSSWASGSDYNIGDYPTATGGAHDKTNVSTVTFVNAAGDDFRISASDTQAKGAGEDLSFDPYLPFSADIQDITRTDPWDIGASTSH